MKKIETLFTLSSKPIHIHIGIAVIVALSYVCLAVLIHIFYTPITFDVWLGLIFALIFSWILAAIQAALPIENRHPKCPKCGKWAWEKGLEYRKDIDKYRYEDYWKCKYCGAKWMTEGDTSSAGWC